MNWWVIFGNWGDGELPHSEKAKAVDTTHCPNSDVIIIVWLAWPKCLQLIEYQGSNWQTGSLASWKCLWPLHTRFSFGTVARAWGCLLCVMNMCRTATKYVFMVYDATVREVGYKEAQYVFRLRYACYKTSLNSSLQDTDDGTEVPLIVARPGTERGT